MLSIQGTLIRWLGFVHGWDSNHQVQDGLAADADTEFKPQREDQGHLTAVTLVYSLQWAGR